MPSQPERPRLLASQLLKSAPRGFYRHSRSARSAMIAAATALAAPLDDLRSDGQSPVTHIAFATTLTVKKDGHARVPICVVLRVVLLRAGSLADCHASGRRTKF